MVNRFVAEFFAWASHSTRVAFACTNLFKSGPLWVFSNSEDEQPGLNPLISSRYLAYLLFREVIFVQYMETYFRGYGTILNLVPPKRTI